MVAPSIFSPDDARGQLVDGKPIATAVCATPTMFIQHVGLRVGLAGESPTIRSYYSSWPFIAVAGVACCNLRGS